MNEIVTITDSISKIKYILLEASRRVYVSDLNFAKYVVYANVIPLFISSLVKIVLMLNEAPLEACAMVEF